jgi:hypothetical protein
LTSGSPEELESALPFGMIEVKARPRKTMRIVVAETEGISDWRPVGDRLRLAVPDDGIEEKKVLKSLKKRLKKESGEVIILRETKRTMEDVFVHTVEVQRSEAASRLEREDQEKGDQG